MATRPPVKATLKFHQQQALGLCGRACIQMMLASLDQPTFFPIQEDILLSPTNIDDKDIIWAVAPDRLVNTLNDKKDAQVSENFYLVSVGSEPEVTSRIIWNIQQFSKAAIALVYGYDHWLVVMGYTTKRNLQGPDDTQAGVESLDLYDPWPEVPGPPPPPHEIVDICGTGGDRGTTLNNISYLEWTSTGGPKHAGFMSGISKNVASCWRGKFLAVCLMEAAAGQPPDPANCAPRRLLGGRRRMPVSRSIEVLADDPGPSQAYGIIGLPRTRRPPRPDFDPAIYTQAAPVALKETGLAEREEWSAPIGNSQPTTARLVQRLGASSDTPNATYVIVLFTNGSATPVMVRLDMAGNYLQATAAPYLEQNVFDFLSVNQLRERLDNKTVVIDGKKITIQFPDLKREPDLVWTPCLESFSPFVPFYRLRLSVGPVSHTLYVRTSDGQVFTKLTTRIGGA